MSVRLRIPPALRRYAGGAEEVSIRGATLADALEDLFRHHPDLRPRVLNERGEVQPYLVLFVNEAELERGKLKERLADGDVVEIVGAAAGG
ncbi:MAG: MoaD/ThiS family protein [Planctomycetota bacterium]